MSNSKKLLLFILLFSLSTISLTMDSVYITSGLPYLQPLLFVELRLKILVYVIFALCWVQDMDNVEVAEPK